MYISAGLKVEEHTPRDVFAGSGLGEERVARQDFFSFSKIWKCPESFRDKTKTRTFPDVFISDGTNILSSYLVRESTCMICGAYVCGAYVREISDNTKIRTFPDFFRT